MTSATELSTVVSAERKRALLLEARRDRVSWVDSASVPFRSAVERDAESKATSAASVTRGGCDDGIAVLRSARACSSMPSAIGVVNSLYCAPSSDKDGETGERSGDCGRLAGLTPQEAGERVKWLLESDVRAEDLQMAMMSTAATKPGEDAALNGGLVSLVNDKIEEKKDDGRKASPLSINQNIDSAFISSYCAFLHKLRTPECAELVQALRRFVSSFDDVARAVVAKKIRQKNEGKSVNGSENDNEKIDADTKRLASMIQGQIKKMYDAIEAHPQWKLQTEDNSEGDAVKESFGGLVISSDDLKESIEIFIHAKCHTSIQSFLVDDNAAADDNLFRARLDDLQFVMPKHLDIECLAGVSVGDKGDEEEAEKNELDKSDSWLQYFSLPIQALQSVESQYSPSRMLSCIHDVYRGINAALSSAMASAGESGTPLPSADDVLPALILVVLRAQPRQVISNLRFVEAFASPDQLRGEAGYAFTNLFSAVQFLRDLDIDKEHGPTDGEEDGKSRVPFFSMTAEEFRKGLEKCREDARKKAEERLVSKNVNAESEDAVKHLAFDQMEVNIPVRFIQSARLSGEVLSLEWACKWQEENFKHFKPSEDPEGTWVGSERTEYPTGRPTIATLLPDGFSRSYNFLSAEPDDIRISEIPQLLSEYQILVRATESLLNERTAQATAQHKRQVQLTRDKLESSAKDMQ